MKTMRSILSVLFAVALLNTANAQQPEMQNFRQPDQRDINQFEAPKDDAEEVDGVKVRVGGGMALQFQGLSHQNTANNLVEMGKNFNLPTANLDLDVQLFSGVRMHLRTYLSSRHHTQPYVKGGYLQIDRLDFIREGFLSGLMDRVRIKVGHMENNYGDARFRRTDNGQALYNPFVGNYIMDAFTTEVGGEVYYMHNGIIAMVGMTNGRLNQSVLNVSTKPALLAKFGYDGDIAPDVRFRLTGSVFSAPFVRGFASSALETGVATNVINLYTADRAGARYYRVMQLEDATADDFRSGRINPDMNTQMTSVMINPFLKAGGLEFFGLAEFISGRHSGDTNFQNNRNWTHLGGELLYRFGTNENFYIGGRYNTASGQLRNVETDKVSVNRLNIGGGWFMTRNILTKLEYMTQSYNDYADPRFAGAKFNGVMLEAAISF
jgi:hypothetical protein